jgi:hypothetical protein
VPQAASSQATAANKAGKLRRFVSIRREKNMWLLMLEAGAALLVLLFIVWWTMFSGRGDEHRPRGSDKATGNENDTPRS